MRVVSLVPSWTETLVAAGVNVVGRTRYCIHPGDVVSGISVVGGTKRVNWDKIRALKPDYVVFDKEENTKEMAEACEYSYIATHVTNVASVAFELTRLGQVLGSEKLGQMAQEWREVSTASIPVSPAVDFPGVSQWILKPRSEVKQIVYMIWRKPWMAINPQTFIGDVLRTLGYGSVLKPIGDGSAYPEVDLDSLDKNHTLVLFSSEPYPFAKHTKTLSTLGFASAIVDGELFSWFGQRSLRFLQKELGLKESTDT